MTNDEGENQPVNPESQLPTVDPPVTLIVSSDETNWQIARQERVWGVRAGAQAGISRVPQLEPGALLAAWVKNQGFLALCRITEKPQTPWPADKPVPWADGAEYVVRAPFEVAELFDVPVELKFPGGYSKAMRLGQQELRSYGLLDDAQLKRLRELASGEVAVENAPPFARAWVIAQPRGHSEVGDIEGHQYRYPVEIPNARGIEVGDLFICSDPGSSSGERIFGVARVGQVVPDGDGRTAQFDRYIGFEAALTFQDIGGDPRSNPRNSINRANLALVGRLLARKGLTSMETAPVVEPGNGAPPPPPSPPTVEFNVTAIQAEAQARRLQIPVQVIARILAALESGKHIILTGAPGTAKTSLAKVIAKVAAEAGKSKGWTLTTATADWTTYETIGGLRPAGPDRLVFEPGYILRAIGAAQWLIIDELNRSNFDRAFGQLFTVLSGQSVYLPYRGAQTGRVIAIAPSADPDQPSESAFDVFKVPEGWRLIATMNVFDKTLLFEMSYALMRRFAFIEVEVPEREVYALLIREAASSISQDPAVVESSVTVATNLLSLRTLHELGPAVYMDVARYCAARLSHGDQGSVADLAFEAFYSYLLPQFEAVDEHKGDELFDKLLEIAGASNKKNIQRALQDVLGLELHRRVVPPRAGGAADAGDEDVQG